MTNLSMIIQTLAPMQENSIVGLVDGSEQQRCHHRDTERSPFHRQGASQKTGRLLTGSHRPVHLTRELSGSSERSASRATLWAMASRRNVPSALGERGVPNFRIFEQIGPERILVIAQPRVIPSSAAGSQSQSDSDGHVAGAPRRLSTRRVGLSLPASAQDRSLRPLQPPFPAGVGSSCECCHGRCDFFWPDVFREVVRAPTLDVVSFGERGVIHEPLE